MKITEVRTFATYNFRINHVLEARLQDDINLHANLQDDELRTFIIPLKLPFGIGIMDNSRSFGSEIYQFNNDYDERKYPAPCYRHFIEGYICRRCLRQRRVSSAREILVH